MTQYTVTTSNIPELLRTNPVVVNHEVVMTFDNEESAQAWAKEVNGVVTIGQHGE